MRIQVHTPPGYIHHPYRPEETWQLDDTAPVSAVNGRRNTKEKGFEEEQDERNKAKGQTVEEEEASWLQGNTDNPYTKVPLATLVNLLPAMSVWIKYKNRNGEKRSGGILAFNGAPNYIKLYNSYTRKSFSVQLKDNVLFARRLIVEQNTPKSNAFNTQTNV